MSKNINRIKVLVNYPKDQRGIEEYNRSNIKGILCSLRKIMSDDEFIFFIEMLRRENSEDKKRL